MNVSEAIARSLVAEGVGAVFSLLGDTNMETVVRLRDLGVEVHESRHEATAMAMADGYARASGRVAVCAVTAGPGLVHTLVPLTSAARTASPVIVLTGPHSRDDVRGNQAADHEGLARLAGAAFQPVASAGSAVDHVRSAMDTVRCGHGPVVLDVPADVQALEYPWDVDERDVPGWTVPQRIHPDPAMVSAAAELLRRAERPVVLAGAGALASGATEALRALAERCGALLATTLNVRGLFHGDPYDAGVAGLFSLPASAKLFAQADCVVAFGASLNRYTTESGYLFPLARFVQVDVRPPQPMKSGESAHCYVQGDARAVAEALLDAVSGQGSGQGYRTGEVARSLREEEADVAEVEIEQGTVDPRAVCALLDELLPDVCGFVSGGGHFWSFPVMHMSRWRQPVLFASNAGAIGYGVPVALGAAVAFPSKPFVVFEGDASVMMHLHILETAARVGAPLLVVIMNDRALGAEYHKLRAKGLDATLSLTPDFDLAGAAVAMGCRASMITDVRQVPAAVDQFRAEGGPLVLDVRVSRNVVSQPYRRLYFATE